VRRILVGLFACLTLTFTVLVVPVYAAPTPEPEPVATSTDEVVLGSVEEPAPEAEVQAGTTDPVAGVPADATTLTVSRTGVDEFSLVGVTWAHDPAVTDTLVQVRVQDAGGEWGEWTEVLAETADQGAAESRTGAELRGGTAPLWTGPSTGVEVELVTRAGAQPTDVRLDLVDPGTSDADTALSGPDITDTAHADTTMPPVYSRAQWGADESIRTWDPQYAGTIKAATLHHSADSNDYTADQVPAIMRSIYRYHTVSLGWGDIGYNVIVDKFGRLWEGRAGGLASTVIGAHAGGFNTSTFGVSMLGNYDLVPVPQVTVEAVAAIIAWKFSLFGIDPRGTTVLTSSGGGTAKYAANTPVTLPTIFGHRDVGSTVCPGVYGYARLGEIRDRVTAMMGGPDSPPSPEIEARYAGDAGLRSLLGAPVGGTRNQAGVVWQVYGHGRLYYSAASGVHLLMGTILEAYLAAGGPAAVGAPLTDELATPDGVGRYNHLTGGGSVYWTPSTGAHVVSGPIRTRWSELGWENSALGYPVADSACGLSGGGCRQEFQNGMVAWSPSSGAHAVQEAPLRDRWSALGREAGALGYPITDGWCGLVNGGCFQVFQGGSLYWSPATGAQVVRGLIRDMWGATGWETGWLGYPTSDVVCGLRDGGCFQHYQLGSIYSSATGVHPVNAQLQAKWASLGWEAGTLGYPTTDVWCGLVKNGCFQQFQGGSLYWSPATGAQLVRGPIRDMWGATGWETGWLGYPTSDVVCGLRGGGCFQHYQFGSIYSSAATGVHPVNAQLQAKWASMGWETGGLGYPTTDVWCGLVNGGCFQQFQGGSLYWTAGTGAKFIRGAIRDMWGATGWEGGWLGYPTSDETCGLRNGGCFQDFQHGAIYSSPATGARIVGWPIQDAWAAQGWEAGAWGYPTANAQAVTGGVSQRFQGGTATWNSSTGTVTFR
jgi:uncharacterized protein with LGFP repeats